MSHNVAQTRVHVAPLEGFGGQNRRFQAVRRGLHRFPHDGPIQPQRARRSRRKTETTGKGLVQETEARQTDLFLLGRLHLSSFPLLFFARFALAPSEREEPFAVNGIPAALTVCGHSAAWTALSRCSLGVGAWAREGPGPSGRASGGGCGHARAKSSPTSCPNRRISSFSGTLL